MFKAHNIRSVPGRITPRLVGASTTLFVCLALSNPINAQSTVPVCASQGSDSDGDGWGWENNQSCIVTGSSAQEQHTGYLTHGLHPACASASSDPDGDGFGWENNASCAVGQSSQSIDQNAAQNKHIQITEHSAPVLPSCNYSGSDPDGDGYGWENNQSCKVTGQAMLKSDAPVAIDSSQSSGVISISDVTDVVLVTGQSNVLGSNTSYNSELDQPNPQVFAFTNSGWAVADLTQRWDRFQHPGIQVQTVKGGQPNNSFAFHFGKNVVSSDSSKVVAFIVVPDPGKGIATWDKGSATYNLVSDKVRRALAAIPHKNTVDLILWHQGENDWHYEGTIDKNATGFSTTNSYEYTSYYKIKLDSLISNFRNESWGQWNTPFICGETRRATGVNRRLMALNENADRYSACVPATDLPKRQNDPNGSHFSAEGLRSLGGRYADAYLRMPAR